MWVVLFHASLALGHTNWLVQGVLSILHAGWFGVEIFFVLSGFLITGILLAAKDKPAAEFFGSFYWRRTLRIFPIYFLVLALLLLIPLFAPALQTEGWVRYVHDQGWYWLYGANILREYAGNSVPRLEYGWFELTHTWSLAVEEHFYLMWPLLVYTLSKRQLWFTALALIALSLTLHFVPLGPKASAIFATPKHLIGLCVGACLAMRPVPVPRWLSRPFEARWLVFLGTYSYGLYLYHYLFGPLWRRVDLTQWPGGYTVGMVCFTVLYLALPLIVAVASFQWIETPIMRFGATLPHRTKKPVQSPAPGT